MSIIPNKRVVIITMSIIDKIDDRASGPELSENEYKLMQELVIKCKNVMRRVLTTKL